MVEVQIEPSLLVYVDVTQYNSAYLCPEWGLYESAGGMWSLTYLRI